MAVGAVCFLFVLLATASASSLDRRSSGDAHHESVTGLLSSDNPDVQSLDAHLPHPKSFLDELPSWPSPKTDSNNLQMEAVRSQMRALELQNAQIRRANTKLQRTLSSVLFAEDDVDEAEHVGGHTIRPEFQSLLLQHIAQQQETQSGSSHLEHLKSAEEEEDSGVSGVAVTSPTTYATLFSTLAKGARGFHAASPVACLEHVLRQLPLDEKKKTTSKELTLQLQLLNAELELFLAYAAIPPHFSNIRRFIASLSGATGVIAEQPPPLSETTWRRYRAPRTDDERIHVANHIVQVYPQEYIVVPDDFEEQFRSALRTPAHQSAVAAATFATFAEWYAHWRQLFWTLHLELFAHSRRLLRELRMSSSRSAHSRTFEKMFATLTERQRRTVVQSFGGDESVSSDPSIVPKFNLRDELGGTESDDENAVDLCCERFVEAFDELHRQLPGEHSQVLPQYCRVSQEHMIVSDVWRE